MIVDNQTVLRRGVVNALADWGDIEVVAEAGGAEEALVLALKRRLCLDVVLVGLKLPEISEMNGMSGVNEFDGMATIQALHAAYPGARLIAFTDIHDTSLLKQAMQAGAVGYLPKGVAPDALVQAIRSEGDPGPETPTTTRIAAPTVLRSDLDYGQRLTDHEREVLALLAEPLSYHDIAERLMLSQHTVKFHVRNICTKLGTRGRSETAILAWQRGLIPAGERGRYAGHVNGGSESRATTQSQYRSWQH